MKTRILMPTDGSDCSELAIRRGLTLAKQLGAEVTFLFALHEPTMLFYVPEAAPYRPTLYDSLKQEANEALERAMRLASEAGVSAKVVLVENMDPVEAIHKAEQGVDLVVMGTHGRRGFNRVMLGSVAEEALRRSRKPYLMVRGSEDDAQEAVQAG